MKKSLIILFFLILLPTDAISAPKKMVPSENSLGLSNIFIYTIPDNEPEVIEEQKDTPKYASQKVEEEIILDDNATIGASTLKGYAQYVEDANIIHLKNNEDEFVLNIKTPQKIASSKNLNFGVPTAKPTIRYIGEEYKIAPNSINASSRVGNFTIGAQYNNEVDNIAMLEEEAGLFTKYEKNRFTLSSSVTKSLNTTYAQDYNTISVAPELRLNNYMSLKNVFSADVTRNKRAAKLVFSINPFGKKDLDRMNLELGAKQTYNVDTEATSTQFSFSTKFRL